MPDVFGTILMLVFVGAIWTHFVASMAADEGARQHYRLAGGALAAAIAAGYLSTAVALWAFGKDAMEAHPTWLWWLGSAVGLASYLCIIFVAYGSQNTIEDRPSRPSPPKVATTGVRERRKPALRRLQGADGTEGGRV
jgi:cytochrome bd-type quinol oxidase subunit 2